MPVIKGDSGQFAITDLLATNAAASLSLGATILPRVSTKWESNFKKKTGAVPFGSSINIKIPSLLKSREDFKWEGTKIAEREKPLVIDKVSRIPLELSLPDMTFNMDSDEARAAGELGQTAGATIAAACDADIIAKMVLGASNGLIAPDTGFSNTDIDLAAVALEDNAIPEAAALADKTVCFSPTLAYKVRKTSRGLYNPQTTVADMFLSGELPKEISGFAPVPNRRIGTFKFGTGSLAGFSIADGSNRATVSSTTGFKPGDRIVLKKNGGNVKVVDPYSKTPVGTSAMRAIIAIEGATTLVLSQDVVAKGVNQNVEALPDGAAYIDGVDTGATYDLALVFYREAFTFASPELDLGAENGNGVAVSRESIEGVNLAVTKQYVNTRAANTIAFQAIWGSTYVRPEWASVIFIPRA
jgi:hypothetical protein